jgi:hypothetical protein
MINLIKSEAVQVSNVMNVIVEATGNVLPKLCVSTALRYFVIDELVDVYQDVRFVNVVMVILMFT